MGCKTTLGNLCSFRAGTAFPTLYQGEHQGDLPFIKVRDMNAAANGRFINVADNWITRETASELKAKAQPAGAIVFAKIGEALKANRMRQLIMPTIVDNNMMAAIPADSTDSYYLYYLLTSLGLANWADGTALPYFKQKTLASIEVDNPGSIEQQRRTVSTLKSLDDKIELNNRLNGYLEELLLAKYDKLFPVNADFTGILSDVGTVIGGATPSKKRSEYYCSNGIGWITPRDLSNTSDKFIAHGADDITDEGYASCSAKLLPKGSVLFSSRAPIGYVAIATNEVATNQGFKSVVPKEEIGTAFVYCFLVRNKQRIADMGAGTTFPEVSGKMMKSVELAVPEQSLCAEFDVFAEPILKQQETLERENRDLAALRNALLPKLMSGEIDVSKIDLTQLNSHLAKCFMFIMVSLSIC